MKAKTQGNMEAQYTQLFPPYKAGYGEVHRPQSPAPFKPAGSKSPLLVKAPHDPQDVQRRKYQEPMCAAFQRQMVRPLGKAKLKGKQNHFSDKFNFSCDVQQRGWWDMSLGVVQKFSEEKKKKSLKLSHLSCSLIPTCDANIGLFNKEDWEMGHFSKNAANLPQSNKNQKIAPKHNMFLLKPRSISSETDTLPKLFNGKAFISELGILWKYHNCREEMSYWVCLMGIF